LSFPKDADDRETLNRLGAMGYRKPLEVSATVRRWMTGAYPSLRGEFARTQFTELVPVLARPVGPRREPGCGAQCLRPVHRRFEARCAPVLVAQAEPGPGHARCADAWHRARLADILARYPEAMDALLEPTFFGALPDETKLEAELARSIKEARSYEDFLDRLRLFSQEQMFLVGARVLSDTVSAEQAWRRLSRGSPMSRSGRYTAGGGHGCLRTTGRIRRQQTALLALGKLRRPRDDGDVRSRSHHRLRFRCGASAVRRGTSALRARSILRG
jgi:glutamate-ammonia-ligase adenylyltransferase